MENKAHNESKKKHLKRFQDGSNKNLAIFIYF